MTVREYDVVVRVRVATYASDIEVKLFSEALVRSLEAKCTSDPAFICEGKPTVEVRYDPRT